MSMKQSKLENNTTTSTCALEKLKEAQYSELVKTRVPNISFL